ncbi:MAG: MFS transporter [Chloroflexi bacterium]|nr:MFS transporter [Chloroflexota bacterium]
MDTLEQTRTEKLIPVQVPVAQVTPRQMRENLGVLAGSSFLRGAHTSIYNVIWQPFVLSLGASMPTLGLLNSLGGMNGIITTLVQPLGGWFADRLGRRPFMLAASAATIIGYALFAIAGQLNLWTMLTLGVIFLGATALANPARSSMTAESVRVDQHGSAFSLIMVAAMVPGIVAPTVGGWVADRFGFVSFFPIAIALEGVALFLVWRYLRETRAPNGDGITWRDSLAVLRRSIIPPKGLAGFFIACAGDSFAWGMGWGLLYGMISETYHFSAEQLGLMSSVMSLTWAVTQMPIGRYIDRRGAKGMMIFSESLGIPLMLIWMTQSRFEIFVLSQILFAITAATWVPVVSTFLTRQVTTEERAEAFGRLNMFRGLVAFPAPTIGGLLYAWGGMRLPLMANLIGSVIVVGILIFFVHETHTPASRES